MERAPARLGPSTSAWLRGFGKVAVTASFLQANPYKFKKIQAPQKTKAIILVGMMALEVFVAALARPPSSWCTAPNHYGADSYDDTREPDHGNGRNGSRVRDGVADHDNAMKIQDQGWEVNQSN
jgi:hypothetical protein